MNNRQALNRVIANCKYPKSKNKETKERLFSVKEIIYTKKPVQVSSGLKNPIKLNISADTLNKISKKEV